MGVTWQRLSTSDAGLGANFDSVPDSRPITKKDRSLEVRAASFS
jgi:hypothetical protein